MFLTGTGGDLRKPNSPLRSPLVEQFQVLTFDQRGMGQSDKPDVPYLMLDYAQDAIAILDAVGWSRTHLVGYSFGGMVAQELAIRWPDRIDRLVLAATTAGGAGGSSYPIQDFVRLEPRERAQKGLEVSDIRFTPDWQVAYPAETEQRIKARMAAQTGFSDEPGSAIGNARQLAARAGHDTFDRLKHIQAETLVIAGNFDGQAPIVAQRELARSIANAQFATVDGGHSMIWDTSEVFEKTTDFLSSAQA